jgi:hypothetical protein
MVRRTSIAELYLPLSYDEIKDFNRFHEELEVVIVIVRTFLNDAFITFRMIAKGRERWR